MKYTRFIYCSMGFFFCAILSCTETPSSHPILTNSDTNHVHYRLNFDQIVQRYDTLIPILDGCFITYGDLDTAFLAEEKKSMQDDSLFSFYPTSDSMIKEWGVIDSNGHPVVPFICDGISVIDEEKAVCSRFQFSLMMTTAIPRSAYYGTYFLFDQNGKINSTDSNFINIYEYWRYPTFSLEDGPEIFLPDLNELN